MSRSEEDMSAAQDGYFEETYVSVGARLVWMCKPGALGSGQHW